MVAVIVGIATAVSGATGLFWKSSGGGGSGEPSSVPGASFLHPDHREQVLNLRGKWRFATGDDPRFVDPGFDDSAWRPINVPAPWEREGFHDYDGFGWYRTSFQLTPADERPLYLVLGRIDDVDEVFLNGERVGGRGWFPPEYATAWNHERVYPIPPGLLEPDGNVIAVRVYDARLSGGMRAGSIGIYTSKLPVPVVDLAGIWKLRAGDEMAWREPQADETGFAPARVPGFWDFDGLGNHDGHAWYRTTFELQSVLPPGTSMVLLLGRIDDYDEVFLNGQRIGATGDPSGVARGEGNEYRQRRAYPFSSSLLARDNTLAVRVYDSGQYGGIYEGPVGIMTADDHERYVAMLEAGRDEIIKPVVDWLLGRK